MTKHPDDQPESPALDGLPARDRPIDKFEDVFGVPPSDVLNAMMESGDDPANQAPKVAVRVSRVGVIREHVPVRIRHPLNGKHTTVAQCTVEIGTELPGSHRGIHVSRLGDALARACSLTFNDLAHFARHLCEHVSKVQYQGNTRARAEGKVSWLESVKGPKAKLSLEQVGLVGMCERKDDKFQLTSGIEFSHITACPCVQQTLKHTLRLRGTEPVPVAPNLTHSQRTCTTLQVVSPWGDDHAAAAAELLHAADETVMLTFATLPRDQELQLVHRAHTEPQFLEDVVRLLAYRVATGVEGISPESRIDVLSRSIESIHPYDLVGELHCTADELRRAR